MRPGKNILVETNLLSTHIAVDREIKWDEVNFQESLVYSIRFKVNQY